MNNLLTRFAKQMDKNLPLSEYPRPQFMRSTYLNLNGKYDYAIYEDKTLRSSIDKPQGEIIVPFSPECILSGVNKILQPEQTLCYQRIFNLSVDFLKDVTLLHFGAVDYSCQVYLNGMSVGSHIGGYTAFSLDISKHIKAGENTLFILVTDPTDTHYQQRGKQKLKHGGIWYTPSSGIWQTVWIESLVANYIRDIKIKPNIDNSTVSFEINSPIPYTITLKDSGKILYSGQEKNIQVSIDDMKLWSPENPYLYYFTVDNGEDKVESYFAMRKFSVEEGEDKTKYFALNNKPYLINGLLDQGYWSDGMYTCATDEGLIYDIEFAKQCGYNTLRKHIKIEPMRWYYHCDRLGMLVWQDFINGGTNYKLTQVAIKPTLKFNLDDTETKSYRLLGRVGQANKEEFVNDLTQTVNQLYNVPSIGLWTVFNEAWGQFDSQSVTNLLLKLDDTRVIDSTSGWYDQGGGDMKSIHRYVLKLKYPRKENRMIAFTEFGGYSIAIDGHIYSDKKSFGYLKYKERNKFTDAVSNLYLNQVRGMVRKGAGAFIYTQLSDVEEEINGLVTYDREIEKLPKNILLRINEEIYREFNIIRKSELKD